jgi:FHA domain
MAKLVLSRDGAILYQCVLDKERLNVGRELHNQVVIDDAAVSKEHAAITPVGNDHILEDLGSVNGTYVNGARVLRQILQHGDVIGIGGSHLRYLNPRASAGVDLERTMLIEGLHEDAGDAVGAASLPAQEVRVPSARPVKTHYPKARVRAIAGNRAGSVIELDRVVATFGKPGHQLAVVTRRPHGYFITHVEGRRCARVNRQSVGNEVRLLHNGDIIEVADEKLQFFLDLF